MGKIVYLIRHSGPFVEYDNQENMSWYEFNKNMILSVKGEENAKTLCKIVELKGIKKIYSSNSARAIGTAKYIAEMNNVKIKIDNRINEREFGIEYLSDLPKDFTECSFIDKNFKIKYGESLNDMDNRFNEFISDILSKNNKSIIVIHGIMLLSYLQNNCDFKFENGKVFATYRNKMIVYEKPKNPSVYKITYNENNDIINIESLVGGQNGD